MNNLRPTQAAALALGFAFAMSAPAQLVTNGGFETGDLSGWTASPTSNFGWGINEGAPNSGSFSISTGCVDSICIGDDSLSTTNYLYEDLNTTVGATYAVSFFYAPDGGSSEGGEQAPALNRTQPASFDELLATFGGATVMDLVDLSGTAYAQYTQSMVATSAISRLEFQGRNDPDFLALDDISVTLVGSGTPEPGTIFLGLSAALLFVVALRSRRRARPSVYRAG